MAYKDIFKIVEVPTAAEVDGPDKFVVWAQASFGAPWVTTRDYGALVKKAKQLFENQPGTDWQTIVQVAQWCASKKRRVAFMNAYVDQFRYAWEKGAIDLQPRESSLGNAIADALAQETDPAWRSRLRRAVGSARQEVLDEWRAHRASV